MVASKIDELKTLTTQDINDMTHTELYYTARNYIFQTNSRLAQIERSGLQQYSPAYASMAKKTGALTHDQSITELDKDTKIRMKSLGGLSNIDNITDKDLKKIIREGRNYLNLETSTVKGTKETYVKTFQDTGLDNFEDVQKVFEKVDVSDFWDVFHKIREQQPAFSSEEIETAINEYFEQNTLDSYLLKNTPKGDYKDDQIKIVSLNIAEKMKNNLIG